MSNGPVTATAPELIRQLAEVAHRLHDTRSRLDGIAHKSAGAAERVLGVVEQARQQQRALRLAARRMAQCCGADPARLLPAAQVLAFAGSVEAASARIDQQLAELLRVQQVHDLAGEVVALVADLAGTAPGAELLATSTKEAA
jgi:chemotaxis protein CheZ